MVIDNGSYHQPQNNLSSSVLCTNMSTENSFENCTNGISSSTLSSPIINHLFHNSLVIIFVLSVLSIFGVCFMIFGPLQRSEAYKRVENFTFGRHPIFNVDHQRKTKYFKMYAFGNHVEYREDFQVKCRRPITADSKIFIQLKVNKSEAHISCKLNFKFSIFSPGSV